MAYTINLTDGTIFATIADGTINTSSSMTLVGKNYAGYGEFLDENFIHLLENGSNTTAPSAPLTGQIWWDKGNSLMKVYNGSTWKVISASTASSTAPTSNVTGDLWYDTTNQLLKVYTGTTWLTVGPSVTGGTGAQGSVGIPGQFVFTQSTPTTTWNINHNLGTKNFVWDIRDTSNNVILPDSITFTDTQKQVAVINPELSVTYNNVNEPIKYLQTCNFPNVISQTFNVTV